MCMLIEANPGIHFNIFQRSTIEIGIAAKDEILHILIKFLHQVGDGLNGATRPKRRKKSGNGDEDFFWVSHELHEFTRIRKNQFAVIPLESGW